MRLDAHQHFWALERGDYGWLTPDLAPIYRDFLPADLAPILKKWQIDGTILVQAAPSLAETRFMLDLAKDTPFIKGVVGWVDFDSPEAASHLIDLAQDPHLVGLRPMLQDIEDSNWVLQPRFAPVFETLIQHGLVFDALIQPRHLSALHHLAQRHPDLRIVIDHGAKPHIAKGTVTGWSEGITALAQLPNIHCKLSGLVTEAGPDWSEPDLTPYLAHLLNCFGPQRLIWGSDWPVCTLASSYDRWVQICETFLAPLPDSARAAIFGLNAEHVYNLRS
ncbi:MAG: amidohydrolase family protein [Pelagimonas sp.]|jgi:L-fuconolactonase|nr:amidohydrolase family protein [Pelagimonas sp.]